MNTRPCRIKDQEATFHTWEQYSEIVPPELIVGGHSGGVVASVFGIVERADGTVGRYPAGEIVFTDRKTEQTETQDAPTRPKPRVQYTTVRCPFCEEDRGTLYGDATNKEYFAYCEHCGVETDMFRTRKEAAKAWENKEAHP